MHAHKHTLLKYKISNITNSHFLIHPHISDEVITPNETIWISITPTFQRTASLCTGNTSKKQYPSADEMQLLSNVKPTKITNDNQWKQAPQNKHLNKKNRMQICWIFNFLVLNELNWQARPARMGNLATQHDVLSRGC